MLPYQLPQLTRKICCHVNVNGIKKIHKENRGGRRVWFIKWLCKTYNNVSSYKSIQRAKHISVTFILLVGREMILTTFQWYFALSFKVEEYACGIPLLSLSMPTPCLLITQQSVQWDGEPSRAHPRVDPRHAHCIYPLPPTLLALTYFYSPVTCESLLHLLAPLLPSLPWNPSQNWGSLVWYLVFFLIRRTPILGFPGNASFKKINPFWTLNNHPGNVRRSCPAHVWWSLASRLLGEKLTAASVEAESVTSPRGGAGISNSVFISVQLKSQPTIWLWWSTLSINVFALCRTIFTPWRPKDQWTALKT